MSFVPNKLPLSNQKCERIKNSVRQKRKTHVVTGIGCVSRKWYEESFIAWDFLDAASQFKAIQRGEETQVVWVWVKPQTSLAGRLRKRLNIFRNNI